VYVGLNFVFLVPGKTGGMEVAARELLPALRTVATTVRFTAFVNREAAQEDLEIDTIVVPVRATNRIGWVRGEQQLLLRLARTAGCDLVHSLGSTAPASRCRRGSPDPLRGAEVLLPVGAALTGSCDLRLHTAPGAARADLGGRGARGRGDRRIGRR